MKKKIIIGLLLTLGSTPTFATFTPGPERRVCIRIPEERRVPVNALLNFESNALLVTTAEEKTVLYPSGAVHYIGSLNEDHLPHGNGTLYRENGTEAYRGAWENDRANGYGAEFNTDGSVKYEGNWIGGQRSGQGKSYFSDGTVEYEGEWRDGQPNGQGKSYTSDGKLRYEGDWQNGRPDGQGTKYASDGSQWRGCFSYGSEIGDGKEFDSNGVYKGESRRAFSLLPELAYNGNWQSITYFVTYDSLDNLRGRQQNTRSALVLLHGGVREKERMFPPRWNRQWNRH